MISWEAWQTLLAIFRNGSYAKAGKVLNVDPTTVGRRLKQLERRVGYPLFLRHEGKLFPTSQCEQLLSFVENADEALRQAEQSSVSSERGTVWRTVRITAPPFLLQNIYAPASRLLGNIRRVRLELIGTGSNLNLTRREADIAVRIEDNPASVAFDAQTVIADRIATLEFAVYHLIDSDPASLPWGGLVDTTVRTTGTDLMHSIVGREGLQYRVSHFDALAEIIVSGAAKGLLPCFIAQKDERLARCGEVVLTQPLWMLYHRQDSEIPHQITTRQWLVEQTRSRLKSESNSGVSEVGK